MATDPFDDDPERELHANDAAGVAVMESIRALPGDADPVPSARAVLGLLDVPGRHAKTLGMTCRGLPVPIIHAIRTELERDLRPQAVFLRVCLEYHLEERGPAAAWERALQYLRALEGSAPMRALREKERLEVFAGNSAILLGAQTAAVACEGIPRIMASILVFEGSEASLDALIAQVERALRTYPKRLETLRELQRLAPNTPAMDALFSRIQAGLDAWHASLPAARFARELGLEPSGVFSLVASIYSADPDIRYSVRFQVDDSTPLWFTVELRELRTLEGLRSRRATYFNSQKLGQDDFGLGACAPGDVPQWLARAAARLQCTWDIHSNAISMSGKNSAQKERIARWLMGVARP